MWESERIKRGKRLEDETLTQESGEEKKQRRIRKKKGSRLALGLVTLESIPTIPFCCFPIVSGFQLEGYSKEYLFG